ncbi:replication initiator protein [Capybara microvirus Cap3_SP_374]|nr:replication initiator protein [Capybara microvirus Cap3_SP_374]
MECLNPVTLIIEKTVYNYEKQIKYAVIDNQRYDGLSAYDIIFYSRKALENRQSFPRDEQNRILRYNPREHQFYIRVEGVIDGRYKQKSIYFTQQVACRHCVLCVERQRQDITNRILFETETYGPPIISTLTYNNQSLPTDGLNYSDVQKLFKVLRQTITRHSAIFTDGSGFRYFVAGEYGSITHRAHYHLLLWNFPTPQQCKEWYLKKYNTELRVAYDPNPNNKNWYFPHLNNEYIIAEKKGRTFPVIESTSYLYQDYFIRYHWKRGLTLTESMRGANTQSAATYCAKYVNKSASPHPNPNMNPTFYRSSTGNGGLGSRYIREYIRPYILTQYHITGQVPLEYVYRPTNTTQIIHVPIRGYLLDQCFPTVSQLLPARYIEYYQTVIARSDTLQRLKVKDLAPNNIIRPMNTPRGNNLNEKEYRVFKRKLSLPEYNEMIQYLKDKSKDIDFKQVANMLQLRKIYLENVAQQELPYRDDLSDKSIKYEKLINFRKNRDKI